MPSRSTGNHADEKMPQENTRYGEKWSVGNFTGKGRDVSFRKDFFGLCSLDQIQRNQVLDGPLEIAHGHSGSKRNTGKTFAAI
jgi:hypothetical protein